MAASPDGILVVESPAGEEAIPLRTDMVTAFVGPAPRGPAHIPVAVENVDEFRQRFGSPAERSRLEWALAQFFDNGGQRAIVVRVPRSAGSARLSLPGPGGALELRARNPGQHEYLRAAVDIDGVAGADLWRLNLTVQRVRSPANPLVEEQETWRNVSVDPEDDGNLAEALTASQLVRLEGELPRARPYSTANGRYIVGEWDRRAALRPTDYDLLGSEQERTGLHALDLLPAVDSVCLLSGSPDADVGPVALFAAERYCARRGALLLLDPPHHWTTVDDVIRTQRERGFTSPNVVTYFPRLVEALPLSRRARTMSALGAVAGMLARRDHETDSHASGLEVLRVRGKLALGLEPAEAAMLARHGVNGLCPAGPSFAAFTGDVTLTRAGTTRREWRRLALRRRALAMIAAIARGTHWATVAPPGADTWRAVAAQARAYLEAIGERGGLAGRTCRERAYVKCDAESNRKRGQISLIVGLALERPGDFATFQIEHTAAGYTFRELHWQSRMAIAS